MSACGARGIDCLIIADDLTGACDSAVHFAGAGVRVCVPLDPDAAPNDAQVLAWSTESRNIDPVEAACRVRRLGSRLRAQGPRIVYKKIDSTLRGNTGIEIIAALEAFGCDAAIINPAFPAMGRIVHRGSLYVPGDPGFRPVALSEWLRDCGAETCAHVDAGSVAAAIDSGTRFISIDAQCDEHLAALLQEALAIKKRILWVGSAGLASALARHFTIPHAAQPIAASTRGPVLFCIGSDHPVTIEQQRRLAEQSRVAHVVLRIPPDCRGLGQLRPTVSNCQPAALFVCGGDTASLVCSALGVNSIELRREFAPGIPEGILHGGVLDGIPVLTKSGGFGKPDDLLGIAEYFNG